MAFKHQPPPLQQRRRRRRRPSSNNSIVNNSTRDWLDGRAPEEEVCAFIDDDKKSIKLTKKTMLEMFSIDEIVNMHDNMEAKEAKQLIKEALKKRQMKRKGTNKMTTAKVFDKKFLDKVILPEEHKQAIFEALGQEELDKRHKLFVTWGFDDKFEKGRGIVLLFYGIPGTGKTMCAELISQYLNRDFMLIGNAELQSSVPGQVERNIKELFQKAKSSNQIIIFDECDSLIYDRGSVGAILASETNCLLSEIERFDGIVVMTTNRNQKLDQALERRVVLKLEFPKPCQKTRQRIFEALIPEKCPLEKNVCLKTLAKHPFCGGNIKNVIFSAARRAVYEHKNKVRMEDFEVAVERELKGKGAFTEHIEAGNNMFNSFMDNYMDNKVESEGLSSKIKGRLGKRRKAGKRG